MNQLWKEKRVFIEQKDYGQDMTEEDARKLFWDNSIKDALEIYKNTERSKKKEMKSYLEKTVKDYVSEMGYPKAYVKLTSKCFEILAGHKLVKTRGNGGSIARIEWDEEKEK